MPLQGAWNYVKFWRMIIHQVFFVPCVKFTVMASRTHSSAIPGRYRLSKRVLDLMLYTIARDMAPRYLGRDVEEPDETARRNNNRRAGKKNRV